MTLHKARIEALAHRIWPQNQGVEVSSLKGGVSADSFVIQLMGDDEQRWVLRCPKNEQAEQRVKSDLIILKAVDGGKLPVPRPKYAAEVAETLGVPGYLYPMLAGRPVFDAKFLRQQADLLAGELAEIHATPLSDTLMSAVPELGESLQSWLDWQPPTPDLELLEPEIRSALSRHWSEMRQEKPALLQGDFWPGNLLWQDDRLTGVVDWEDALLGSALFDLAIARLDLSWVSGASAAEQFTKRYQQVSGCRLDTLPQWDLLAALRPCQQLSLWSASWPELGRPDMTYQTMRDIHNRFTRQALARCT